MKRNEYKFLFSKEKAGNGIKRSQDTILTSIEVTKRESSFFQMLAFKTNYEFLNMEMSELKIFRR